MENSEEKMEIDENIDGDFNDEEANDPLSIEKPIVKNRPKKYKTRKYIEKNDEKRFGFSEFDEAARLKLISAECGHGWKAQISRVAPQWCAGILETIDLDPTLPLDIEEIRSSWGGRKLKVKIIDDRGRIRKQLGFQFPDQPRNNGLTVSPPNTEKNNDSNLIFATNNSDQRFQALLQAVLERQTAQPPQNDVLIKHLSDRCAYLENQINQISLRPQQTIYQPTVAQNPPTVQIGPGSGIDLLSQVAQVIKQVDDLKKALLPQAVAEAGGSDGFIESAAKTILEYELDKRKRGSDEQKKPAEFTPLPNRQQVSPNESTATFQNSNAFAPIMEALQTKIAAMSPDRLEQVLQIVLEDIPLDFVSDEAADPQKP